jgi:hypothetical protein
MATTTTILTADSSTSAVGQDVIFTAIVSGNGAPGGSLPTGWVVFHDTDGSWIGEAPVIDGVAQLTVNYLTAGDHVITAEYGGDSGFLDSFSDPLDHTVLA